MQLNYSFIDIKKHVQDLDTLKNALEKIQIVNHTHLHHTDVLHKCSWSKEVTTKTEILWQQ